MSISVHLGRTAYYLKWIQNKYGIYYLFFKLMDKNKLGEVISFSFFYPLRPPSHQVFTSSFYFKFLLASNAFERMNTAPRSTWRLFPRNNQTGGYLFQISWRISVNVPIVSNKEAVSSWCILQMHPQVGLQLTNMGSKACHHHHMGFLSLFKAGCKLLVLKTISF